MEVAGDAALFVNPESIDDIRRACVALIEQPALRTRLIDAGSRNVARFQAELVALAYAAVYSRVLQEAERSTS